MVFASLNDIIDLHRFSAVIIESTAQYHTLKAEGSPITPPRLICWGPAPDGVKKDGKVGDSTERLKVGG